MPEACIDVIERRIDASDPGVERRALRLRLAQLQRDRGDRSAEIDALQTLLGETGDDVEALALLGDALLAESRHGEAAVVLERRAELARTEGRACEALLLDVTAAGQAHRRHAGGAARPTSQVFALLPASQGALADVTALARAGANHEAAAMLVIPRLEAAGRWPFAEVWVARTGFVHDPGEKATALRALAKLRLGRSRIQRRAGCHRDAARRGRRRRAARGARPRRPVGGAAGRRQRARRAAAGQGRGGSIARPAHAWRWRCTPRSCARGSSARLPARWRCCCRWSTRALATAAVCSRAERPGPQRHDGDALQRKCCARRRGWPPATASPGRRAGAAGSRAAGAGSAPRRTRRVPRRVRAAAGRGRAGGAELALFESTDAPEPALLDALEGAYQNTGDTAA
ncbi:MAG: hypothetical protein U0168_23535 [Nannocystaceae bacterium]